MAEHASTLALGTLGIAFLLVSVSALWRYARHLSTLVHESGHATMTLLTGYWVGGIQLNPKGGGVTWPEFKKDWKYTPSRFVVLTAGYPAPSLTGLVLARGVQVGWDPLTVLWTFLVILAVLFFAFLDNLFALSFAVFLALVAAVFVYQAGPVAQLGAVVALSWILLLSGLRKALEASTLDHKKAGSDQAQLQGLTGIHAHVWSFAFVFVALASLITGARWLLIYA
jgi:hypothetical protein